MIEAQNLSKRFGSLLAVDRMSFTIEKGSVTGFLGPNGAGKSTTMRLLTGFLAPDHGTARVCGHDIRYARGPAQRSIGYLPEAIGGFPHITVREFLTYCGETRGYSGRVLDRAIDKVCDLVALTPAMDRRMRDLSKGWRQRAWFAQAILHDPPVLILDEPTDGLDPGQKDLVRTLIRSISAEKAIVLSTHILEEAEELCDRTIIIVGGRIVRDAPLSELLDSAGRLASTFRRLSQQQPAQALGG